MNSRLRRTHTYSTLEVSPATIADIKHRIMRIDAELTRPGHKPVTDYQEHYIHDAGTPDEVIVFGTIGLIPDPNLPTPTSIEQKYANERWPLFERDENFFEGRTAWRFTPLIGPYCFSKAGAFWEWLMAMLGRR